MESVYHERQSRQYCLVHALNALLQRKQFTSQSLDEICYNLNESRWFNPHRSMLGLGNYDVNVLMVALGLNDLQHIWFDARKDVSCINLDKVDAMIFNIPSKSFIPFWNGRHWFTVLKLSDGSFVNLDSNLNKPFPVEHIREFAREILSKEKNQLILVGKCSPEEFTSMP